MGEAAVGEGTKEFGKYTRRGIGLIARALLIYFVVIAVNAVGAIVMVLLRPEGIELPLALAVVLPLGILAFVGGISAIVGYVQIYQHTDEVGKAHDRNVKRSLYYLIGVIAGAVVIAVVVTVASLHPLLLPSELRELGVLLDSPLFGQGIDVFIDLLLVLALYSILLALLAPGQLFPLRLAVLLYALGAALAFSISLGLSLTGGLSLAALEAMENPFTLPAEGVQLQDLAGGLLKSLLQAIAILLFWSGYQTTRTALKRGSVKAA